MNLRILSVASLLILAACMGDLRLKVVGVAPESHACELVVTQRGKVISDLAVSGRFDEAYAVRPPTSGLVAKLICDGLEIAKGTPGRDATIDLGAPRVRRQ
ncbi:hypothetical protein [Lysobacter sp. cf310]|uniref:hypothetical protein n=1 Tax=Lysobacter sp. cf310 TaxID=1761790 RepID=UPI001113B40B|nr:hypothetical protein [Lysobacter sp. cf310]